MFAILVIFSGNSIVAILCFILAIMGSALFLILAGVEFLAFSILLIYVGAISVLILFSCMMLKLGDKNLFSISDFRAKDALVMSFFLKFWYICCSINLCVQSFLNSINGKYHSTNSTYFKHELYVGSDSILLLRLYDLYCPHFLLVGFIILTAMVGAITICGSIKR
jgi:NADH:ubiquinone oxidoreductase subunit 6 (subunit J)